MNRFQCTQIILVIAVFMAGLQCGMTLTEIFLSTAPWTKLAIPAFGSTAVITLSMLLIIKSDRFKGKTN